MLRSGIAGIRLDSILAPEAQRTLAGGGAGRNHRSGRAGLWRPGRDAGLVIVSAPTVGPTPRRGARPFRCQTGGFTAFHHRLMSAVPPAQRTCQVQA